MGRHIYEKHGGTNPDGDTHDARMSSYNRQHPLTTDTQTGEMYDPLERNLKKYDQLFEGSQPIDEKTVREIPLSIGLLQSYAEVVNGGKERFTRMIGDLVVRYKTTPVKYITDVADYAQAVEAMRDFIKKQKAGPDLSSSDEPPPPPRSSSVSI